MVRDPVGDDLAQVVSALCTAITEGELGAGSEVMVRTLARRTAMSSGRVAEALARLAAGRYSTRAAESTWYRCPVLWSSNASAASRAQRFRHPSRRSPPGEESAP